MKTGSKIRMQIIIKFSILLCIICAALAGCTKNQTDMEVPDIKAGDSTSANVHYIRFTKDLYLASSCSLKLEDNIHGDFIFNYSFQVYSPISNGYAITVRPIGPYMSCYLSVDGKGYPIAFNFGDGITDSLNWTNTNRVYILASDETCGGPNGNAFCGNWLNLYKGYLGFKIVDKAHSLTYKGWIGVSNYEIENYAYIVY